MNRTPSLFDYAVDDVKAPDNSRCDRAEALIEAANRTLAVLASGKVLSHDAARAFLTQAFGASDASGAWQWKDVYEAQEVAGVLFLRQYRSGLLKRTPAQQLATLDKLQSLMLTHSRRSDISVRYQQFSTPFVLGRVCALVAQINAEDWVLEPSAGTGILAANAEMDNGRTLQLNQTTLI